MNERVTIEEAVAVAVAVETVERETAHGNLLAVIHRDGGHHVERVGWPQAAKHIAAEQREGRRWCFWLPIDRLGGVSAKL